MKRKAQPFYSPTRHCRRVVFFLLTLLVSGETLGNSAEELGPDLPPFGHSLFDEFVEENRGLLPTTYPELRDALTQFTRGRATQALIPMGRSLQRFQTDFADPRILLAFDTSQPPRPQAPDRAATGRLYVAFAKRTATLEVISFNERLGRFEFQVVRDVAPGKKPRVFYAPRALCLRCHQGGQPIFSEFPWSETDVEPGDGGSDKVHTRLPPTYEGVRTGGESFDEVQNYDGFVQHSRSLINFSQAWPRVCRGDYSTRTECRRQLLTLALEGFWNDETHGRWDLASPSRLALQKKLSAEWPATLPPNVSVQLADRDPLKGDSPAEARKTDPDAKRLSSPAWPAPGPAPHALDSVARLLDSVVRVGLEHPADLRSLKVLTQNQFEPVRKAMATLPVRASLAGESFSRAAFLFALYAALSPAASPPPSAEFKSSFPPRLEPLMALDPLLFRAGAKAPRELELAQLHCARCHSGSEPGPMNFLSAADPVERWEQFRTNPEVRRRLTWENLSDTPRKAMPPQNHRLITGFTEAIRLQLVNTLGEEPARASPASP